MLARMKRRKGRLNCRLYPHLKVPNKTGDEKQNLGKNYIKMKRKKKEKHLDITQANPVKTNVECRRKSNINCKLKCPNKTALIGFKISLFPNRFTEEQKVMSKSFISTDTQIHSLITLRQGLWIWNLGSLSNHSALLRRLIFFVVLNKQNFSTCGSKQKGLEGCKTYFICIQ